MRGVPFDAKPIRLVLFSVTLNRVSSRFTDALFTVIVKPKPVKAVVICWLPLP